MGGRRAPGACRCQAASAIRIAWRMSSPLSAATHAADALADMGDSVALASASSSAQSQLRHASSSGIAVVARRAASQRANGSP